jgi:hypothetical protein
MTDCMDSSQEDAVPEQKPADDQQVEEENKEAEKEPVVDFEQWCEVPRPFVKHQTSDSRTPRSIPDGGSMAQSITSLIPDSNLLKLMGLEDLAKAMDAQAPPPVAIPEGLNGAGVKQSARTGPGGCAAVLFHYSERGIS